jgi:tetratricopeptide (TPR) repeat protein
VDKSLVIAEERDGTVRYRMLETVRQYAAEKLAAAGEADATQEQHARWCLALAEAAHWSYRNGPGQQMWLDRLTIEHDNLRAALGWGLADEHGAALGLQLGRRLVWWWLLCGHFDEGRRWLAALLERAGDAPPDVRAGALEGAARLAAELGDYDEAVRLGEECLALRHELGEKGGIAGALYELGAILHMRGDHTQAERLFAKSLALAREAGDPKRIALALNTLGVSARNRGEPGRAVLLYEESLALARKMEDMWHTATTLVNLGNAYLDQGALDEAVVWYRECLPLTLDLQSPQQTALCLQGMASVAVARGDAVRAARLCGAAAALREATGVHMPAVSRARFEKLTADARAASGEPAFAAAWAAGQALSPEEAIADALAEAAPA